MSEQIETCRYCGTGLDEDGRVAVMESSHYDSQCREYVYAALLSTKRERDEARADVQKLAHDNASLRHCADEDAVTIGRLTDERNAAEAEVEKRREMARVAMVADAELQARADASEARAERLLEALHEATRSLETAASPAAVWECQPEERYHTLRVWAGSRARVARAALGLDARKGEG